MILTILYFSKGQYLFKIIQFLCNYIQDISAFLKCLSLLPRIADCFLQVVSATLLLFFISVQESTWEAMKNNFYFTLNALFILEIINLNFSDIQMSWCHQMVKHEKQNTFY